MRILTGLFILASAPAMAGTIGSTYSTFDFDKDCVWTEYADAESTIGGDAVCTGLDGYPVYFAEFDIRQHMAYGPVDDPMAYPGGFGNFNYVNHTIEWRMEDGKPFAAIQRWFVDAYNTETDQLVEGQVLVVSTVADPAAPEGERISCPVAYVDALANKDANTLARQVADERAAGFVCGVDRPEFVGERGPLEIYPRDLAE